MTSEEKDQIGLSKDYKMKIDTEGVGRPRNIYHAAQCIGTWSAMNCVQRLRPHQVLLMLRTAKVPFLKTAVCQYMKNEKDEWEAISYSYSNEFTMMSESLAARAGIPTRKQR